MTRRLVTALVAAAAIAAACPAAASAFVFLAFTTGPGPGARVDAFDFESETSLHIELLRAGAAIATSTTGSLEVAELRAGDTVRLSPDGGTTVIATVTYDGTPALGKICIGSSRFTVTRPPGDQTFEAGAGVLSESEESLPIESTMSADSPAVVTLARPLAPGDAAFAQSTAATDDMLVGTGQTVEAKTCTTGERPDGKPAQNLGGPDAPQGGMPQTAPLSAAAAAVRLKRLGLARLGRSGSVTLPVAFAQRGTLRLKLLARGKVIGTGTKTAAGGDRRVTVKLTAAGRKLVKRAKRLKLTLRSTFTPSRAGEAPQRASVSVTLRR